MFFTVLTAIIVGGFALQIYFQSRMPLMLNVLGLLFGWIAFGLTIASLAEFAHVPFDLTMAIVLPLAPIVPAFLLNWIYARIFYASVHWQLKMRSYLEYNHILHYRVLFGRKEWGDAATFYILVTGESKPRQYYINHDAVIEK